MNTETENISHELLVQHYQNGDKEALKLLIRTFHPKLVQTIFYYTKDQASVDDLTQDCWYAILEKLPDLKLEISFGAWAHTIARRKSIDWIRKQQRSRKRFQTIKEDAELKTEDKETGDREEKLKRIHFGIQQLSPTKQIVLKMFYLENLSLREISKVLDISKGTVKSRLFYARENLKNLLNQ